MKTRMVNAFSGELGKCRAALTFGMVLTVVALGSCARSDGGAPVYFGGKNPTNTETTPVMTSSVGASGAYSGNYAPGKIETKPLGNNVIRVSEGDTIFHIARKYGIYPSELVRENDLQAPYKLTPGQLLRLPDSAKKSNSQSNAAPAPHRMSTVAAAPHGQQDEAEPDLSKVASVQVGPGDTLYGIARTYGTTPKKLAAANGLKAPFVIRPGEVLQIPHGGATVAAAASPPAARGGKVVVQNGDTLYSIARTHGVSVASLQDWNGIDPGEYLKVGQTLTVNGRNLTGVGGASYAASEAADDESEDVSSQAAPAPVVKADYQPTPAKPSTVTSTPKPAASTAAAPAKPAGNMPNAQQAATPLTTASIGPYRGRDGFIWPVRGEIISRYGPKQNGLFNDGINIAVNPGTPVRAAKAGVVSYAGEELEGYGKLILIKHADGYVTAYAHNSRLLVRKGDQVRQGDVIAESGATGKVDRPQLHFQIRKGRKSIDPVSFFTNLG